MPARITDVRTRDVRRQCLAPLTAVAALLLLPSVASAAAASADVKMRNGVPVGPVTFTAARGEANRLTISEPGGELVFRDGANPVRARGDCRQVDRNTARCPFTEDIAQVRLRDRGDRVRVRGGLVDVHGGGGGDLLRGSSDSDRLFGDAGNDTVRGGRDDDRLTGGAGRDRVFGGTGDDDLIDGETDAQAARDVYQGGRSRDAAGPDRGDELSYARRRRALRMDLGRRRTSTEDRIRGMESLVGGRGGDRLTGDGDDNNLEGGPGNDVLRGRGGRDIPLGGRGNDRSYGDAGDDVVWGDEGRDRLFGGTGDDFLISLEEQGPAFADVLACGRGADDARSDSRDTLTGACEEVVAFSNGFSVGSLPGIDTDSADFELTCFGGSVEGCHGTIRLTGPGGAAFGSAQFDVATDAVDVPVSVPLSAAAVAALERGTIVTVDLVPDAPSDLEEPGGYRASMVVGQAAQPPSSPSSSSSVAGSGSSATAAHGSHASSAWRS
jgi:hypothetical protein